MNADETTILSALGVLRDWFRVDDEHPAMRPERTAVALIFMAGYASGKSGTTEGPIDPALARDLISGPGMQALDRFAEQIRQRCKTVFGETSQ